MSALMELAERCEKATGPDRELDKAIALLNGWACNAVTYLRGARTSYEWEGPEAYALPIGTMAKPPFFTASLDAAITLVPEGWLLQGLMERNASGQHNWRWKAEIWHPATDATVKGIAKAAHDKGSALALCAAALRARATQGDK